MVSALFSGSIEGDNMTLVNHCSKEHHDDYQRGQSIGSFREESLLKHQSYCLEDSAQYVNVGKDYCKDRGASESTEASHE